MSSVVVLLLAVTLTFGAIAVAFGPFFRRTAATTARVPASARERPVQRADPDPTQNGSRRDGPLRRAELLARLHALALGAEPNVEPASPKHAAVEESIAKKIEVFATNPRYAPRRPGLLPELLRAVNDDETTRQELAAIIARDPALVGNLLKLANSAFYRTSDQPVESVDRAGAVLGTEGIRSLVAAALMQPVLRKAAGKPADFVEIVWEQTYRTAAAAEAHAAFVEKADRFAGQLLGLLTGLGTIIVYRAALDRFAARKLSPDPAVIVSAVAEHAVDAARHVAEQWGLSERVLEALADAGSSCADSAISPLGRSLRFGLSIGALAVLRRQGAVDEQAAEAAVLATDAPTEVALRIWSRIRA